MPSMLARAVSGHEDTYWVSSWNTRVLSMASAWETKSNVDFNGGVLYASLETPVFRGWQRFHRKYVPSDATSVWQRLYLSYDAVAGMSKGLNVAYTTSPELGAAYTTAGQLATTSGPQRNRLTINPNGGAVASRGIAFKLWEDLALGAWCDDLRINDLELEFFTREGSR
jgi:hypothetical protein